MHEIPGAVSEGMANPDWYTRLFEAVENDGRSDRALSLAASLGPNYVNQIRNSKKAPKLDEASRLCSTLNVSIIWLLTGIELDAEGEELIRLAVNASHDQKLHMIGMLRSL